MKISIVIASTNRADTLSKTLIDLQSQSTPPEEVILSVVKDSDFPPEVDNSTFPFAVRKVIGKPGLTCQRNLAISKLSEQSTLVTMLDDDVFLHSDYLQNCLKIFEEHEDCVCLMGHLLQNGNIDPEGAKILLKRPLSQFEKERRYSVIKTEYGGLYGCNMTFRKKLFEKELFDERLPLYSEMEDLDMGSRAKRWGQIGYSFCCLGVHLQTSSGRINYRMRGFSQIMNAWYLMEKGTLPRNRVVSNILKSILKNAGSLLRTGQFSKRKDILTGNFFALLNIVKGKIEPELIYKLK